MLHEAKKGRTICPLLPSGIAVHFSKKALLGSSGRQSRPGSPISGMTLTKKRRNSNLKGRGGGAALYGVEAHLVVRNVIGAVCQLAQNVMLNQMV